MKFLKIVLIYRSMKVLAKIESLESLYKLEEIVEASDGIMVARGDLGVEIPLEKIPIMQEEIVNVCRQLNKPVIVASQLLESMIEYPTPTRADVLYYKYYITIRNFYYYYYFFVRNSLWKEGGGLKL